MIDSGKHTGLSGLDARKPISTYFISECPICGRALEVQVEHIGRRVMCQHCRGEFTALLPEQQSHTSVR